MKKSTLWCLGAFGLVVLCLAAADKTLPNLPLGTGPSDSDLMYVVSGGVDHRVMFSQVRTALNSTLFAGTTTNLINYQAFTLPNIGQSNWGYPLIIGTDGKLYKGYGLLFNSASKFYSGFGFAGDARGLYNVDGNNLIDGSLSAAHWQFEDPNTFLAGPTSGITGSHKPTMRGIVSNDIPNGQIGVLHLAPDVLGLMSSNTNGVTNVFNANLNNASLTNSTNHATFTLTDDSGHVVQLSAGDGLLAPNANILASSFTGDGSPLTNLNASALASGTVPAARLPAVAWATTNQILYVRTNGTDATAVRGKFDFPFATFWAARAAAQIGDTISLGPGYFADTNATPPSGVSVAGSGWNLTFLNTSNKDTAVVGSYLLGLTNNMTVRDLTLDMRDANAAAHNFYPPMYLNHGCTNILLVNVRAWGESDVLEGVPTNRVDITLVNVDFYSRYDTIALRCSGDGTNSTLKGFSSRFVVECDLGNYITNMVVSPVAYSWYDRGHPVILSGVRAEFNACTFTVTNARTKGYAVDSGGGDDGGGNKGDIKLTGCSANSGVASNLWYMVTNDAWLNLPLTLDAQDIYCDSGSTVEIAGSSYGSVKNLSGTVTSRMYSLELVNDLVVGGTIHGLNTSLTNASGQSIATQIAGSAVASAGYAGRIAPFVSTPLTAGSSGSVGQMAWDGTDIYICISPNSWVRGPLSAW